MTFVELESAIGMGFGAGLAFACGAFAAAPLAAFLGLFEAIGFAFDLNNLGVVHEAVDERDDTSGVGEDLASLGEGSVGGDQGGFLLVAARDDLEEQVGMVVGIGEVADLVDE